MSESKFTPESAVTAEVSSQVNLAALPEQRFHEVEALPLTNTDLFLARLDDEAMDQVASAMALRGVRAA